MRVGLVGCVKTKLNHPAAARELYTSTLFRGRRAFVERSCDRWFILSAKHGLVSPEQILEPYDQSLNSISRFEREGWSNKVLTDLDRQLGAVNGVVFEVHAGVHYRNFGLAQGLLKRGAAVEVPTEGMGLFEQNAFYSGSTSGAAPRLNRPSEKRMAPGSTVQPAGGTYAPLAVRLSEATVPSVRMTFGEIEELLARGLPASARNHRAWWANDPSHVQARAWLQAGWRVTQVNQSAGNVEFSRG